MGEGHHNHHHQFLLHHSPAAHQPRPSGRLGGLKSAGEIVEVQGGHIVRSTGRKDRHSKVCTAKGPRDRRVRLSAHTAIQFYDVQDRLGYDRPSKAVDWLIKNAKAAIDELAELPPWHPTATTTAATATASEAQEQETAIVGDSSKKALQVGSEPATSPTYPFGSPGFLPPSMDSDSIADTIKSFFPISGTTAPTSSPPPIGFQSYPADPLPSSRNQAQDLRLSLQSFQDPILLHHSPNSTSHHHHHHPNSTSAEQSFFSSPPTPLVFDATSASWSEHHSRMLPWSSAAMTGIGGGSGGGGSGGYGYNLHQPQSPSPLPPLHQVLGQNSFLSQRGPLQSSNSPSVRAWMEPISATADDDHHQVHSAPSGSTIGFASGSFSGFRIPARIQGEEEHDGVSNKLSSASRR